MTVAVMLHRDGHDRYGTPLRFASGEARARGPLGAGPATVEQAERLIDLVDKLLDLGVIVPQILQRV